MSMDKTKLTRNIRVTYLLETLININFTQALWVTYLAFKGFSLVEIGLCESAFHLTSITMELPTGMVADLYGRKVSRLASIIVKILYLILLFFANSFPMAIAAFVLCAIGYNLDSGSDSALVYDSLLLMNEEKRFPVVQGMREVLMQSSALIGVFIGGLLADISYPLAIFAAIGFFALAFIVGLYFTEPPIEKTVSVHQNAFIKQFIISKEILKTDPYLLEMMITSGIFLSSVTTVHFYLTAYWQKGGFSLKTIALWLMLESIGAILGGALASRIIKRISYNTILRKLPILIGLLLWVIILKYVGVVALFGLGFIDSLFYVAVQNEINLRIPSQQRATVLSVNSMCFSLAMILLFPLIGWIADVSTLPIGFQVLAALVTATALAMNFIPRKEISDQTQ